MIKVKLPQVQCDKSDDKIFHRWPVPPFGWLFSAPLSNNKINSQLLRHDYAKLNSPQKHVGKRRTGRLWVNKLNNANNVDVPQRRACVTAALAVSVGNSKARPKTLQLLLFESSV
ncbi:hypothetical protein T09_7841 [Trichinella sp. T9]|nr:hypothetical protein T09_7841 [Trichinella sp. T9]